jgi:O-antigen/teichoic acid export membrane protein
MGIRQRVKELFSTALFGHAAWMMGGSGLQSMVAFGGNLILVWYLTPEEFGRFAIIQANIGLVSAVVNFKIGEAVLKETDEGLLSHWSAYANVQLVQTVVIVTGAAGILWLQNLLTLEAGLLLLAGFVAPWASLFIKRYERNFVYKNISILESGAHFSCHIAAVIGAFFGMGAIVLYVRELIRPIGKLLGILYLGGGYTFKIRLPRISDWRLVFSRVRGFWVDGVLESSYERLLIISVEAVAGERVTGYFFQAKRLAIVPHQLLQPLTSRIAYNYFSHKVSPAESVKTLMHSLIMISGPLLVAGVCILLLADPLIPFIFGEDWSGVVPLLQGMVGVVICLTLFNTIKFYCMASNYMRSFVILGRGAQFVCLGVAVGLILGGWLVDGGMVLSLGYSIGYAVGVIALLFTIMIESNTLTITGLAKS